MISPPKPPIKCFLSFADSRMAAATTRIAKQAEDLAFFDSIVVTDENNLDSDFRKRLTHVLQPGVRGYGYWCWKPHLILKTLESLPEGSILLYCDAGCHLNVKGRAKLISYFNELQNDKLGVKAFPADSPYVDVTEKKWTKGDVFDYFQCRDKHEITHTPQVAAGHVLCRKCESALAFLRKWDSISRDKFSLYDDSASKSRNFNGFIENRHDQSVFSVLFKLHQGVAFPAGETRVNDAYPIWDKRDKGYKDMRFFARVKRYTKSRIMLAKMRFENFMTKHPKFAALLRKED